MDYPNELTVSERAGVITHRLCRGERLTTNQVMTLCGYEGMDSAWRLMMKLARVLPVNFCSGIWYLVDEDCTD